MCARYLLFPILAHAVRKKRSTVKKRTQNDSCAGDQRGQVPAGAFIDPPLPIPAELKIRLLLKSTVRFELAASLLTLHCHNQKSMSPLVRSYWALVAGIRLSYIPVLVHRPGQAYYIGSTLEQNPTATLELSGPGDSTLSNGFPEGVQ